MKQASGTVYWVTGLSGSGKTTVGTLLYKYLKQRKSSVVFFDGDMLREVFNNDLKHTLDDRRACAMRYSRLCRMLSEQGIDVVCATISMFHECRSWNRQYINKYKEIYIKVPLDVLIKRDQKQMYSRALRGEVSHIVGVDLPVEEPEFPDLVVVNDGRESPEKILDEITSKLDLIGEKPL